MRKITLKIGLTMALLVLVGSVYSQTANTVNLDSSGSATAPLPDEGVAQDDTILTINATTGSVTVDASDPDYLLGASTGAISFSGTFGLTFDVRLKGGRVVDQTLGSTYGSITTTGLIDRAASGDIGVRPTTGSLNGVDNGEGLTFGFKLTNLPAAVTLQVTKISFTTFTSTNETAVIVNRRDTSKFINVLQSNGSNPTVDVSSLDLFVRGGATVYDLVSIFIDAIPTNVQNWRISAIEFKLVDTNTITTVWNGTVWSGFTPTPTMNAIIAGNYSATTTGGFSAKTLTVNSGSLTIEATKNLKIENEVINNAGPTGIIVEEGGTLQQVQTGTNSGAITVRKNSNSLKRGDYTLWSSPVATSESLTLINFSALTSQSPNRFYVYDNTLGTNGLFANIAPSSTFATGTGYLIRMPNENPSIRGTSSQYYLGNEAITFNGEFVGVPNNGTLTTTGLTANKFYSVGNPYPSNLSADSFINGNSTGGTLYFWRKTNGVVGTAYATYTLLGGAGTSAGNGGIGVPSGIIAPCQGFIVKTGAAATTLTFTNAMRLTNTTYGKFFKTKQEATKDRVWLNLSNATGAISQALIGYMDSATLGVDNGIDGEYFNDSPIALTSNIDNKEYTIQGRPSFDATDVVALNFKTDVAGEYSIALGNFDGVFATGQDVYLVDSKTGIDTDLKAGAYNFTAAAGLDNSRFSLKYQKTLKVIDSEFNENSVSVYRNNGLLFVKSNASTINNIKIFDVQGRLIAEQKNVKSNTASFSNLKANQALIVQVSAGNNTVVNKKIVN